MGLNSIMTANSCSADCNSTEHFQLVGSVPVRMTVSMAITQIFVWPFIYINIIMLFTFFKKRAFRTETRYVLFAHTLFVDLIFLSLTDLVILLSYKLVLMPMPFCIPICMLMETVTTCTPLTITAMCMERYVAICMPLRHSAISTVSRTLTSIYVIWIISSIKPFMDVFILVSTAPRQYLSQLTFCYYEIMVPENWQREIRSIFSFIIFALVLLIELFCYVMIVLAARAASVDKASATRSLRTVSLHILQLTLCTIQIICPYIEALFIEQDIQLYLSIRFFNFITFNILARAVSPLVYGLRDEKFYASMIYYVKCRQNHVSFESQKQHTKTF